MAQFPVELWYDGHRVAVVYESNGTVSSGAMAQFPVELWHDDHRVAVVYEGYCTISSGAMVRWSQSCSCLRELWHDDHKLPLAGRELLHNTIHTII